MSRYPNQRGYLLLSVTVFYLHKLVVGRVATRCYTSNASDHLHRSDIVARTPKSGLHKKVLSLYFIEWCCQGVSSVNGIQLSCVHSVERRNIYSHGTGSGISSGAVACCHTPDHCIELNITITGMSNKWLLQVITNKSYAAYTGLVIATR